MLRKTLFVLVIALCAASVASAATLDILWYTGGVVATGTGGGGGYKGDMSTVLTARAAAAPITTHNTYNITYWDAGAMPVGSFDAMVVASDEGFWSTTPNYTALDNAFTGGLSLGDRVMVSGQDADWHFLYSGHQGAGSFNSSQGFLIDAINWAGSGTGMGAVFLSSNASPTFIPTSILPGLGTRTANHGNVVTIPAAYSTFPINEGLTSAGLSNWSSSHHDIWTGYDTTKWTSINTTTDGGGGAVTLVSATTAGGGTTPVPEPGTLLLVSVGFAAAGIRRKVRQRRSE